MIVTLAKKEILVLLQDLHGIAVLFLMPTLFLVIMALAIPSQTEIEQRRVLVSISSAVNNPAYALFVAFIGNDRRMELSGDSLNAGAIINVLAGFDEQNLGRINLVISQNTSQVERVQVQNSIQTALAKLKLHAVLIDMKVIAGDDPLPARIEAVEYQTQLVPLNITSRESGQVLPTPVQQSVPSWLIFGMFFIVLPFSQTLLKEKQNSTALRLRSFGMQPYEMILSKLLPFFVINQLQFWVLIAVGSFVLPLLGGEAFHLQGSPFNYMVLSVVISFTALGLSGFIAVIVKTQEQAIVVGGGLNLVLAALGGIMVPKYLMSDKLSVVTGFSPMGWGLEAFQQLQLQQKTLPDIGGLLFVMMVFSLIMLSLATLIYSRQFWKLGWNSAN